MYSQKQVTAQVRDVPSRDMTLCPKRDDFNTCPLRVYKIIRKIRQISGNMTLIEILKYICV